MIQVCPPLPRRRCVMPFLSTPPIARATVSAHRLPGLCLPLRLGFRDTLALRGEERLARIAVAELLHRLDLPLLWVPGGGGYQPEHVHILILVQFSR